MRRALIACVLVACGDSADPIVPSSSWRRGPAMPTPRLEPGVVALGTSVVVLGGFDTTPAEGLHITDEVSVFDGETETWLAPLPPLPVAWTHINVAAVADTLYVLGGLETSLFRARGETWILDPGATTWRTAAPMPPGLERGAAGVVASDSHIYLLGGASSTAAVATCLAYDIVADTWSELPSLPAPRSHPAAMRTADGSVIVAAGLPTLDASSPYGDVWSLAPGGTAFEPRSAVLARPRGGCAYATLEQRLVCAGGEAEDAASPLVDALDPASDAWTILEPLPANRAGTAGAAIGTRMYVPGGAPALVFVPTDTIYIYESPVL